MTNKRAVILVSGGLDSATVLAIAASEGYELHAVSFDYGQRHRFELQSAKNVCAANNVVRHTEFKLDTSAFQGSALTDDIAVPRDRSDNDMADGIPITYVPARNTVFLSVGLAIAESIGAFDLFIGVNAVDYSGYPDCRPEFIAAFETMANLATKAGVVESAGVESAASGNSGSTGSGNGPFKIHTPLISLTKAEIIQRGLSLGVDYGLTLSCYDPDQNGHACGHCDSCQLRLKGFADAGAGDPVTYQS